MPDAIILAVPRLYDAVRAHFAAHHVHVTMAFGWRAPAASNPGVHRIVWVPGDPSGALGELGPPKMGKRPRNVATLNELVTCQIMTANPATPEDERAQYQVARELYDVFIAAVHDEAHGTFKIVSQGWIGAKKERRFGAAIRVVLSVQAAITDESTAVGVSNAGAQIDVAELDHSETILAE